VRRRQAPRRRSRCVRGAQISEVDMNKKDVSAKEAGEVSLGGQLSVPRLGFGAMRITGEGIFGPPKDRRGRLRFFGVRWNSASASLIPPTHTDRMSAKN